MALGIYFSSVYFFAKSRFAERPAPTRMHLVPTVSVQGGAGGGHHLGEPTAPPLLIECTLQLTQLSGRVVHKLRAKTNGAVHPTWSFWTRVFLSVAEEAALWGEADHSELRRRQRREAGLHGVVPQTPVARV